MADFKVGDRVALYARNLVQDKMERVVCNVLEIDEKRGLKLGTERGGFWFHPKQCRKLKKKERRRIWVLGNATEISNYQMQVRTVAPSSPEYWAEFVEVRKKK